MPEQKSTNPTPYVFIPSPLIIEGKPEFEQFSLNIIFVSLINIDGVDTNNIAEYYPYLPSFAFNGTTQSMRYNNKLNTNDYIDITYFRDENRYEGKKYIKGIVVGSAFGTSWKIFFEHLIMLGIYKDETCKFEPLETKPYQLYIVYVDDNYHFMDESERYSAGKYYTPDEAIKKCKALVDNWLEEHKEKAKSAVDLYNSYTSYGEDPFVKGPTKVEFSAWNYAKKRCDEIYDN